jgi:hypothetical protein
MSGGWVQKIPPIVSQRNHFRPADELVEAALLRHPDKSEHFKQWLTTYTESVIKNVADHFGLAAERGIKQAANLLCDPAFYETRRKRRTEWLRQMRESEERQNQERIERQTCPTAEHIEQALKYSEQSVAYHQKELAKHEANVQRLRAMSPRNIRLIPKGDK